MNLGYEITFFKFAFNVLFTLLTEQIKFHGEDLTRA